MAKLQGQLKVLQAQCKGGVSIEFNPQYSNYESIQKYLEDIAMVQNIELSELIDDETLRGITKANELIELHMYPDTPVGSYKLYHWNIGSIVDQAITLLEKDRGVTYG
ncbi:hypothetical protein VOWphi5012_027 [Vibrio phage phi50-12]|uniref:Uncharacterized protein n=1 Tax=Vibrio phage phi50-12 TaxID=2654972 RepID=A0A5P8PSQ1_9CAUD|nr:hypothetical protein KNU82_gp027 [Vibrio phage phi50-12]QFR59811.1 hypothetical protein VOWphi5012_027 [Vibrio phage phi50-12]